MSFFCYKKYNLSKLNNLCHREFMCSMTHCFLSGLYKKIKYLALKIRSPSIIELLWVQRLEVFLWIIIRSAL